MTSEYGTPHVLAAARVLGAADPGDIESVSALHDQLGLKAGSAQPFALPDYDQASPDATRAALLELARGLRGFEPWRAAANGMMPPRHVVGAAVGLAGGDRSLMRRGLIPAVGPARRAHIQASASPRP